MQALDTEAEAQGEDTNKPKAEGYGDGRSPPRLCSAHSFVLYLVRHGQTEANRAGIIQGHTNYDLTALGRAQAFATGLYLATVPWYKVYSSDLSRAKETADIILGSYSMPIPEITLDSRLREYNFGVRETFPRDTSVIEAKLQLADRLGVPVREIVDDSDTDATIKAKQEEFLQVLQQDIVTGFETMHPRPETVNVLVVSHGGWISSFVDSFTSSNTRSVRYKNCSVTTARGCFDSKGALRLDFIAQETAHAVNLTEAAVSTCTDEMLRQTIQDHVQKLSEIRQSSYGMDILAYVRRLSDAIGWTEALEQIRAKNFIVHSLCVCDRSSSPCPCEQSSPVCLITYMEGVNRDWSKWARQCRAVVLYRTIQNEVMCMKYQMPRSAEVLTSLHIDAGITETQDLTLGELHHLDAGQQETIRKLTQDETLEGFISFKSDGHLVGVTVYRGPIVAIVREWICNSADPFHVAVDRMARRLDAECTIVFSARVNFFAKPDMQAVIVTAIATRAGYPSSYPLTHDQVTPVDVFETHGEDMLRCVLALASKEKYGVQPVTLNFEAVCKDRADLWGNYHVELGMAYDKDGIKFLGLSTCDDLVFTPHFLVSHAFQEPLWWRVSHSTIIVQMLQDLELVLRDTYTSSEFLVRHPPGNAFLPEHPMLDFEGFVFYQDIPQTHMLHTDHGPLGFDCYKMKTLTYNYSTHRFKLNHLHTLLELAGCACAKQAFPLISLAEILWSPMAADGLTSLKQTLAKWLSEPVEENNFFQGLKPKAQDSYLRQARHVQHRMLVNASDTFEPLTSEAFHAFASGLGLQWAPHSQDLAKFLKRLAKTTEPKLGLGLDDCGKGMVEDESVLQTQMQILREELFAMYMKVVAR